MSQTVEERLTLERDALKATNSTLERRLAASEDALKLAQTSAQDAQQQAHEAHARAQEPLFAQFAEAHKKHMSDVHRQLELQNIVSTCHTFDGLSEKYFRKWVKDLDRVWGHHGDNLLMRQVIFRTSKELAADFWSDKTAKEPSITWPEARIALFERFSNFASAELAKDKLKNIQQRRGEELYSFAQRITDFAKEAYSSTQLDDPVLSRILTDLFIDGLNTQNKPVARKLVKLKASNLNAALNAAVEEQLLQKSFRLRNIAGTDPADLRESKSSSKVHSEPVETRDIQPMEVDTVAQGPSPLGELKDTIASLAAALERSKPLAPQAGASQRRGYGRGFGRGSGRGFGRGRGRGRGRGEAQSDSASSGSHQSGQGYQHQWTTDGRPICSHCHKPNHMMSQCWVLHPEKQPSAPPMPQNTPLNQ